jgi:hypothetical protein
MIRRVFFGALVAAIVAGGLSQLPEIRRYLRIKAM